MLFLQMNVCYQCIGIHNSKELNIYLYSHWCCKMDYKWSVASKRPSEIPTQTDNVSADYRYWQNNCLR